MDPRILSSKDMQRKKIIIDLLPKGKKHWAQNLSDSIILLESEGWWVQDLEAHVRISPIKAFVKLKLERPKKTPPR